MSVHGTNPPHHKSFFRIRSDQAPISFGAYDRDAAANPANDRSGKPFGVVLLDPNSISEPSGPDVFMASGLPSYWLNDGPALPSRSLNRTLQHGIKRTIDIVLASLAIVALLPLFMIVALAIKASDPGPALFRQARMGRGGKQFSIFKFRSMYIDQCNHSGVDQTVAGDSRIMPLGNFLRRTSIDELPQLFNVLLGDMSLVGPRPHVEGQLAAGARYEHVVPYYNYRLQMRPGLTGWAQAHGLRGPTDNAGRARARIDHDVAYIQNFSVALDLRIILKTLHREFFNGSGF